MPEQITKYPDITLEVLQGAGAVCGKGAPQKILKQCPAERFCSLPTAEIIIAVALGGLDAGKPWARGGSAVQIAQTVQIGRRRKSETKERNRRAMRDPGVEASRYLVT